MTKVEAIIAGLQLFQAYGDVDAMVENNVFYSGPVDDATVIDQADLDQLTTLGFIKDEAHWGWRFMYGGS